MDNKRDTPFKHASADDSAGFLLWKLTALWREKLDVIFDELDITQTQYAIMASLLWCENQGMPTTQSYIAQHAKVDRMTLSKAIRKLETAGLLMRAASDADSRATCASFTEQGKVLINSAIVKIEHADDAFFAPLSAAQMKNYKAMVLKIVEKNTKG